MAKAIDAHITQRVQGGIGALAETLVAWLEAHGMPPEVVSVFQKVDPLLKEHKAISAWISQQPQAEQMDWRAVLPEVLSVDEAMVIAQGENHLLTTELLGKLRAAFGKYVLTPGSGSKYLTIPAARDAYGKRAREFDDLFFMRVGPKRTPVLARRVDTAPSVSRQVAGRGRPTVRRRQRSFTGGVETMYVLVTGAEIPADPTLIPFEDLTAEARDSAEAFLDEMVAAAIQADGGKTA
jgi:hypothetical protein